MGLGAQTGLRVPTPLLHPHPTHLLTVVIHHSGLLLVTVHREPDDLHLHEGVDDLDTGQSSTAGQANSQALPPAQALLPTSPLSPSIESRGLGSC